MPIASELERGDYFLHNGEPVRVIRREVIVVGTHSHSKLKFFVQGLKEKSEKSVTFQHTDKVDTIDIVRKSGQVVSKTRDKIQIMDTVSYETIDASAPCEMSETLSEGDNVTFIQVNGNTQIIEKR